MYHKEWLIDLLDRKFELVNSSTSEDFLLELANFLGFILENETLKPHTERLISQFQEQSRSIEDILNKEREEVIQLREKFVILFPDSDDSHLDRPSAEEFPDALFDSPYNGSLSSFDYLVNNETPIPNIWTYDDQPEQPDPTKVGILINLLMRKVRQLEIKEVPEKFYFALQNLQESHLHLRREFVNHSRISPASSLLRLLDFKDRINPPPKPYKTWKEMLSDVSNMSDFFEYVARLRDEREPREYHITHLRRVYEQLRADIGTHLSHYELVKRYKARCMWYNRQQLFPLIKQNEGNEEDALTRDLALYLFDNGVSTLYRVRQGVHEYDLIGQSSNAIFVEAKVYKDSNHAKRNLINGIAQLHAYLNALEAGENIIQEIYYVIFRLGGPLYDIPWEIPTNRHIFYPVIIDIGSSEESGRRQPKPIQITLEDFFDALTE